jgi:hypothetical protein
MKKMNFRRCVFTNGSKQSYFMRDLINEESVFNINYLSKEYKPKPLETPFSNVRMCLPTEYVSDEYKWVLNAQPEWDGDYNSFLRELKNKLKEFLIKYIRPNEKYLHLCSSGTDSRFITGTMAELRDEGMDFSNIHFRCHAPENAAFVNIMKKEKWPASQYSTYSVDSSCYNIGVDYIDVNGFCSFHNQMNFWSDIGKEKDFIVITGEGGELFKYIGRYDTLPYPYSDNYYLNMLIEHNPGNGEWDNQLMDLFKDYIMPLWSYEYLSISNRVKREFIRPIPKNGWDNIRMDLVRSVGLDNTIHIGGDYNTTWKISKQRLEQMSKQFYTGRFYNTYKNFIPADLDFSNPFNWNSKLWGFAVTLYDKIKYEM